jgi:hypothetical protein
MCVQRREVTAMQYRILVSSPFARLLLPSSPSSLLPHTVQRTARAQLCHPLSHSHTCMGTVTHLRTEPCTQPPIDVLTLTGGTEPGGSGAGAHIPGLLRTAGGGMRRAGVPGQPVVTGSAEWARAGAGTAFHSQIAHNTLS